MSIFLQSREINGTYIPQNQEKNQDLFPLINLNSANTTAAVFFYKTCIKIKKFLKEAHRGLFAKYHYTDEFTYKRNYTDFEMNGILLLTGQKLKTCDKM